MFTVWHELFSLVLMFSTLRIEALPPSIVQGKCIYTFLKRRTSRVNFHSYVLIVVKINKSICLSKVGSSGADLSATRVYQALSVHPINRPSMSEQSNRAGRFIGQACLLDKFFVLVNYLWCYIATCARVS